MKKVLVVLPSITQTNGIASFIFNYIIGLKKIEFSILTSDLRPSQEYIELCKMNNISLHFLPSIKENGFFKYYKSLKKFFKNNHEYDAIYSNVSNQSMFIFKLAKKYKIDIRIVHSHATQSAAKKLRKIRNALLEKMMLKYATHHFACSIAAGKSMFKNEDFEVINNAIDYKKYSFDSNVRDSLRKKYNLNENNIIIGFVGRFTEQKNIFFFLDIAKKIDDNFKILMIGNGDLKKSFINKIENDNLSSKFIILDEISNVNKYYSLMDYFLLPSLYEGLPVVGVEAQANGLCCLFSNTITDELKISSNVYFLDINDVDQWIDILKGNNCNRVFDYDKKFDINIEKYKFEERMIRILGDVENDKK